MEVEVVPHTYLRLWGRLFLLLVLEEFYLLKEFYLLVEYYLLGEYYLLEEYYLLVDGYSLLVVLRGFSEVLQEWSR